MRLFTGISIPPHVVASLENALAELRPAARLRWSTLESLHITSKFVGEWPESEFPRLHDALAKINAPQPFGVTVARFGFLPNPHRPKIFLAGVRGDAGLAELAAATDSALAILGVRREERVYTPHLTLARIGSEQGVGEKIAGLRERIAALPAPDFGSFDVNQFHLYQSSTGPAGSVYSILRSYPLSKAAS